jgi:hypothetical protein
MASSRSSGIKSADAVIATGRNRVNAITLLSDGTNACSVVVYDNASAASGTAVGKVSIGAASLKKTEHVVFENPVLCEDGIYADVTGTGAEYIVYFGG